MIAVTSAHARNEEYKYNSLTAYEEGSSKDNFLFFNKTTRQYRVYKGTQLDQELSKEGSELKLISGIAFSQKDKQSKATPRMTLG